MNLRQSVLSKFDRQYHGSGQIVENDSLVMTRFSGGFFDGDGKVKFYLNDYQGNNIAVIDANGEMVEEMGYYPYGMPWSVPTSTPYLFADKEYQSLSGLNEYIHGARRNVPYACAFSTPDALCEKRPWDSPYLFCGGNPIFLVDDDGNSPLAAIGAVVGGLIGGGVEAVRQLCNPEKFNWKAVAGATAQGAITGAVAGLTAGASLVISTAAMGAANAVGGMASDLIQGQTPTVQSVTTDALVGGAVGLAGKAVSSVAKSIMDGLSNTAKGNLGEFVTRIKYFCKGYKNITPNKHGKQTSYDVATGRHTKTGADEVARYDFLFEHKKTQEIRIVESKFNKSQLTPNQKRALPNCKYPFYIDRTTSLDLSNKMQFVTGSSGFGVSVAIQ